MKNGKIVVARLFSKYLGGSAGFIGQRMKMVDRKRFETIAVYLSRLSDAPNELPEHGIECFYLSDAPLTSFRYSVLRKLTRILRAQAVDILHCNRHKATFYGALAARSAGGSAVISHIHGLNRCRNTVRRLIYRYLLSPRINCAIGCAEAVRDDIRKNYPGLHEKAISLANSIDYEKYADAQIDRAEYRKALGLSPDSFVFLFVGRFAPTKGLGYLTHAFASAAHSNERAHLLLVGDGRDREQVEGGFVAAGIRDRVTMTGRRSDIPALLACADCFVMSSIAEGMPLSIMEAMAAGLPVISTDVGGVAELLGKGRYGRLVPSRDAVTLADAMLEMLAMEQAAVDALTIRARNRIIENHSHQRIVKQLEQVYERLVSKEVGTGCSSICA
ncbi:MAG: glycosyltransferase [Planctomycetota bacterium]|jgi:glycosyltransferase involved in cell wall biosynthesis